MNKIQHFLKTRAFLILEIAFLVFVMVSVALVSGLYAKYASSGIATGSARVAKFTLAETFSDEWNGSVSLSVSPGSSENYYFTLDLTNCEVKSQSTITIGLRNKSLPLVLTLYRVNTDVSPQTLTKLGDSIDSDFTVSTSVTLPSHGLADYCLKVEWVSSPNDELFSEMSDYLDFSILCDQVKED